MITPTPYFAMLVAMQYHVQNFDEKQWIGEGGQHLIFCNKSYISWPSNEVEKLTFWSRCLNIFATGCSSPEKFLWLSGWASKLAIRRTELQFYIGSLNLSFIPHSGQDKLQEHLSLHHPLFEYWTFSNSSCLVNVYPTV